MGLYSDDRTAMDISILGPLRVELAGGTLDLGGPVQRGLLSLLLTSPNVPVPDSQLIDELWGDDPPASARHLLQVYVSQLRGLLGPAADGPRIVREGASYSLRVEPGELDAERFGTAIAAGRRLADSDPDAADEVLSSAMKLWRGRPFADLDERPPVVRAHGEYLERQRLGALGTWIDVRLRLGRHQELAPELFELTANHQYDEQLHARLMLALYRCGRQAEALETGRALERRLRDDLGIDASGEVRELYRRILLQDPQLALEPRPPPSNLPARLTSFVGREAERREVAALLKTSRLVTLTGPGGIGKTRLAIEVAGELRARYPDGTWWVDLAQLTGDDTVVDVVARVLGAQPLPGGALVDAVVRAIRGRTALVLLDNCEHVAGAVADLVAVVLATTTGPCVLATSRTPLRVEGEMLWTVPPLGLPPEAGSTEDLAGSDAVRLFVERGRAVSPSFRLEAGNAAAVALVCRRLDGLSLGIEMAAARLPVLTPAEIARALDERFAFLELSAVGRLTRHRTMEAAIDASHALLTDDQRTFFERLSVFVGPFDLEAAAAVGFAGREPPARPLAIVTPLVEASLLTPERHGSATRYRLLETLREYGADRLRERGIEDDVRRAHATHYLGLAADASADVDTPAFARWMDRLTESYVELREALAWSLAHDPRGVTLRVAPTLREFWQRRGEAREAGRWTARMLDGDLDGVDADLRAVVHGSATFSAILTGDVEAALGHSEAGVRLARESGSAQVLAYCLWSRANAFMTLGDLDSTRRDALEALATCDRIGDRWRRAGPLSTLGLVSLFRGSLHEARACFEEAVPLFRELGEVGFHVVMALAPLSEVLQRLNDLSAAERIASEAVESGSGTAWEATALVRYAAVLNALGDADPAEGFASRALRVALAAGLENWFRLALRELAVTAASRDRLEDAARFLAASLRNMPAYGLDPAVYGPLEARCRGVLGDDRFELIAAQGRDMGHDELMSLARAG